MSNVKLVYNTSISALENLHRLFVQEGIPREYLDEITIDSVAPSTASEFAQYTDKVGNTGISVLFSGDLVRETGKTSHVWFYDRIAPIPEAWRTRVMLVRDSELRNTNIVEYVKQRFAQDGNYFPGERLSYQVDSTSGNLLYGRNIVNITAPLRSYVFTGVGKLAVQYLVDLNDIQARVVSVVNPFVNDDTVVRKTGYLESNIVPRATEAETEAAILDRFLKETYGMGRAVAIQSEIKNESLTLARDIDFRNHMLNPVTDTHHAEKAIIANYKSAQLYKLATEQVEDDVSKVVGNMRMIIAKGDVTKLIINSGKFTVDEELGYAYRNEKVRSFVFNTTVNPPVIDIKLGDVASINDAEANATAALKKYFGAHSALLSIDRQAGAGNQLELVVYGNPNDIRASDLDGELLVNVTFNVNTNTTPTTPGTGTDTGGSGNTGTDTGGTSPVNPDASRIVLTRNLNGFSIAAPGGVL